MGSLYVYTALVLTSLVSTQEQTGLFGASFRVYIIVASVPGILVTTAFPLLSRAARDDRERLRYATQRLFEGTAALGGAALVTCVLGAAPIIAVVAGHEYDGAIPVLRIQGVALALTFVIATWGFTLLAMHRHRQMIRANLLALLVSATTVLLLARSHGAEGAAFGTLLGESALACAYAWGISGGDPLMRPQLPARLADGGGGRPRLAGVVPAGPRRGGDRSPGSGSTARRCWRSGRCRRRSASTCPARCSRLGPTLRDD